MISKYALDSLYKHCISAENDIWQAQEVIANHPEFLQHISEEDLNVLDDAREILINFGMDIKHDKSLLQ